MALLSDPLLIRAASEEKWKNLEAAEVDSRSCNTVGRFVCVKKNTSKLGLSLDQLKQSGFKWILPQTIKGMFLELLTNCAGDRKRYVKG
jgi:hypothetical protein